MSLLIPRWNSSRQVDSQIDKGIRTCVRHSPNSLRPRIRRSAQGKTFIAHCTSLAAAKFLGRNDRIADYGFVEMVW
jgi:hypothetical protein